MLRLVPVPCSNVGRSESEPAGSGFEVDLDRVDERHEPGEKLEMDRMSAIGVQCSTVRELHDPGKLVPLGARREVDADIRLQNARNLRLKAADRLLGALLLCVCGAGFPSKKEGVDDHAVIVVGSGRTGWDALYRSTFESSPGDRSHDLTGHSSWQGWSWL